MPSQIPAKTITTATIEMPNTHRIVPNVTPERASVVDLIGAWSGEAGLGFEPGTCGSCVWFVMTIEPIALLRVRRKRRSGCSAALFASMRLVVGREARPSEATDTKLQHIL